MIDVTLHQIVDLGNETRHYVLAFQDGVSMPFIPGQFVAVLCPDQGKIIRRAYSIASSPDQTQALDLCIKRVEGGVVTNWFWSLKEGDSFQVHGPFGKFILPEEKDFDLLFVATGTGIAPFRSMIQHLLAHGFDRKVSLLFGARYDDKIPYHQEFIELAKKHPQFIYVPTISRSGPDWQGETGYVQTKIEKFFSKSNQVRVYICGLDAMIQEVKSACLAQGYTEDQIEFEKYD